MAPFHLQNMSISTSKAAVCIFLFLGASSSCDVIDAFRTGSYTPVLSPPSVSPRQQHDQWKLTTISSRSNSGNRQARSGATITTLSSKNGGMDAYDAQMAATMSSSSSSTETLIIGGGLAGTATAFALAEKGIKSTLLEMGSSLAPKSASSNGDSRMYRKMYSSEFFSKMQAQALDRWADVEEKSGTKLLQENGLLFYGEDTGETVEGSVLGAKEVMENLGLPHTFYATGDEIADAYPALEGCRGMPYSGVCEETAGHIRASKGKELLLKFAIAPKLSSVLTNLLIHTLPACEAMAAAAGDKCDVKLNSRIVSLDTQGENGKIVAKTEDGDTITADNAVIASGAWTNSVLESANLPPMSLEVWQIQWGHYEVDSDVAASIPQAFHFRKENDIDGGLYYVFPSSATESIQNGGKSYVKVGVDFPTGGPLSDMESFDYEGSDEVLDLIDGWVKEHLPSVGERFDSYCHPYTMTSDSYFVMDKVSDNVAVFSGGSGRAFKFGPLLGDCMASLLTGEEAPVDMAPFSARREALLPK